MKRLVTKNTSPLRPAARKTCLCQGGLLVCVLVCLCVCVCVKGATHKLPSFLLRLLVGFLSLSLPPSRDILGRVA